MVLKLKLHATILRTLDDLYDAHCKCILRDRQIVYRIFVKAAIVNQFPPDQIHVVSNDTVTQSYVLTTSVGPDFCCGQIRQIQHLR